MVRYSDNLRPVLQSLKPYVAGRGIQEIARAYGLEPQSIVKLGSNENPYGPSPSVRPAMARAPVELYPEAEDFISALAEYTGFSEEEVLVGSGMDGVMDTLTRLFLGPGDTSLIPTPTFSYYEILTRLCGADPTFVRRGPEFQVLERSARGAKMTFLCSPNNPTGNVLEEEDLRRLVESTEGIVFLDEAYVDFARRSLAGLVREYENLVVGRTMSKAFGLAGLRLGYALAPPWIAEQYRRAAPPFFGLTTTSVAAGVAALGDLEHMRRSVARIVSERERLTSEIPGARPSQGNFLYLETASPSSEVAEAMLGKGVIIRDCRSFRDAGLHRIRVTVGTPQQNDRFLEAYREICTSP
ncbi:MAG: histidinol-phosphate transaminase [Methanosarcinales archaeon]|nr:histidinol-phosphate transaminase [Methanosarcinales archaeon]